MNPSALLFHWFTSEKNRWNLGLTLHPPSWNKTRNLPPFHPTTLPSFSPNHFPTFLSFPPRHTPTLPHHPLTCPTFPPKYPPIFLIYLRSSSCSETLITFHFPNVMQNYVNSVLTFYTHSPFPRVAPTPQGLNPYTPCIKKIQKNHHYPNHLKVLHRH